MENMENTGNMDELTALRAELDEVDARIVKLYERRMELCEQVGAYKVREQKKIFDSAREKQKLAAVGRLATRRQDRQGVEELFQQLMTMSRKVQYRQQAETYGEGRLPFVTVDPLFDGTARVVYQGTEGAYGQAAMKHFFGDNVPSVPVSTFREAMEMIQDGVCDYAVLPIENSTAGGVNEVYDLLDEFENYIVGETIIPIRHTLAVYPGAKLSDIRTVYSKAEALMQTSRYLGGHPEWEQVSVLNTAIAARRILEEKDVSRAAVCSELAARLYGLDILEDDMNDMPSNRTRFVVVTNQKVFCPEADKISICFEVPHESGSLYQLLSHFIFNGLNMTRIESRPVEGRSFEYHFFVDFEGNMAQPAVKNALQGLRSEARNLKVLGNYKKWDESRTRTI